MILQIKILKCTKLLLRNKWRYTFRCQNICKQNNILPLNFDSIIDNVTLDISPENSDMIKKYINLHIKKQIYDPNLYHNNPLYQSWNLTIGE